MKTKVVSLFLTILLLLVGASCAPAPGELSVSEKLAPVAQADGTILVKKVYLLEVAEELNFRPTNILPGDYLVKFISYKCVKGAAGPLAEVRYQNKLYFVVASLISSAVGSSKPKC